jgi:maltose alpha-D-glucosyltransferase/alpha-amylase
MQWSPDRNGGFSRCDPARLYLPIIMDPVYGYEAVNVEAQSRSLSSLLSWTKRLISVRRSTKVFGRGSLSFIRPANRAVLVFTRQYQNEVLLCVANLSRSAQAAEIDLSPWRGRIPREMLGRQDFPPIGERPYLVTLAPYGFFWFQLNEPSGERIETPSLAPEFETLVVSHGWKSIMHSRVQTTLERDVLPAYLTGRRWFAERGSAPAATHLRALIPLSAGAAELALALVEAPGKREITYLLPLMIEWTRFEREQRNPNALAAVRRGPREGTLLDAATEPRFIALVLEKLGAAGTLGEALRLEFRPVGALAARPIQDVRAVGTEQSNTTALVGNDFVVKLFRRLEPGENPEIELGRFLAETAPFANVPRLLGTVELVDRDARSAVAVVHRFIENQGDAWSVTNAHLDRYIEEQRLLTVEAAEASEELAANLRRMHQVGRRLAELHVALASRDDVGAFAPEPVAAEDVRIWIDGVIRGCEAVFDDLARRRGSLDGRETALIDAIASYRTSLGRQLELLLPEEIDAMKIRHHGDFHLGQTLVVREDIVIIDFEGEPRRSIEERRRKAPAARDVAGLIRSVDYSATAALARALQSTADESGKLERALDAWRERSVDAVLSGYRQFLGDPRLWPRETANAVRLLDFFLLEKALYEIEYELAHRPDWLRVPLSGILRILSRSSTRTEVAA